MSTNKDSPAFPGQTASGLTKREYFAALALQGLAADSNITTTPEYISARAVRFADALIAELNKDPT